MSSLDARSNLERSGDRDIEHSNLMRYPGTYGELLGDLTKRRPGFEGLRSFDEDVSPLCDFCSHRIAIFEVCRDLLTNKSTRYIETEGNYILNFRTLKAKEIP